MTPCEKLGYKVGDRFEIIGDELCGNVRGMVITLTSDDGSYTPKFSGLNGGTSYYYLSDIKKITAQKQDEKMTKFKITKGIEKDFEGAPDWAVFVSKSIGGDTFWEEDTLAVTGNRWQNRCGLKLGLYDEVFGAPFIEVIASRELIPEQVTYSDGWIEWHGGECPVEKGTIVDTKWDDGAIKTDIYDYDHYWEIDSRTSYIIAYRLSKTEVSAAPVWNGEGLPPVGCRVQYSCVNFEEHRPAIESGEWYAGTIIAYYNDCVWTSDNGIRRLENTTFRQIRSPEEIEREKAIDEIADIIGDKVYYYRQTAEEIYDAGYRKVK